jgi:hypothetical protein
MEMRPFKDLATGEETVLPASPTRCGGGACAVRLPSVEKPVEKQADKGGKK